MRREKRNDKKYMDSILFPNEVRRRGEDVEIIGGQASESVAQGLLLIVLSNLCFMLLLGWLYWLGYGFVQPSFRLVGGDLGELEGGGVGMTFVLSWTD